MAKLIVPARPSSCPDCVEKDKTIEELKDLVAIQLAPAIRIDAMVQSAGNREQRRAQERHERDIRKGKGGPSGPSAKAEERAAAKRRHPSNAMSEAGGEYTPLTDEEEGIILEMIAAGEISGVGE